MAKRPKPKPAPSPAKASRTKVILWGVLILLLVVAVALPTLIVIGIGMLPTAVAWMVDRTESRYAGMSVLGMNFAGVFPYLMDLWGGNHTLMGAGNIVSDVFALVVMYGSAGMGWLIFLVVPPIVTSFMTVLTERRLTALRANQKRILDEWGQEVAVTTAAVVSGDSVFGNDQAAPQAAKPGGQDAPAALLEDGTGR